MLEIEQLEAKFRFGYTMVVIPTVALDVPIGMSDMQKEDGYFSVNELSEYLGGVFTPVHTIDERFSIIQYSFRENDDEKQLFKQFLEDMGLVNMRNGKHEVSDIEFDKLNGNEYGIFSVLEAQQLPQIGHE